MNRYFKIGVIIAFCPGMPLLSQALQRSVISCVGSTLGKNGVYYSHTVGQPSNTATFYSRLVLRQGFQQPHALKLFASKDMPDIQLDVFPNPFVSQLNIKLSSWRSGMELWLMDNEGKCIAQQKVLGSYTLLHLQHLPYGTYFIVIAYQNQPLRYARVVKLTR
jgi:hypothetical protein